MSVPPRFIHKETEAREEPPPDHTAGQWESWDLLVYLSSKGRAVPASAGLSLGPWRGREGLTVQGPRVGLFCQSPGL